MLFYGVHSAHSDQRGSMKCCIINKGNSWNWDVGLGVACRKRSKYSGAGSRFEARTWNKWRFKAGLLGHLP